MSYSIISYHVLVLGWYFCWNCGCGKACSYSVEIAGMSPCSWPALNGSGNIEFELAMPSCSMPRCFPANLANTPSTSTPPELTPR